jgi:putative Mg2+ transporter-C (MgtC) family protein
MDWTEFVLRVSVAVFLGICIGLERQWRQRMAGLRTHTLVCMGSALFVTVALMTTAELSPTRIAAQIVSGIGFLGAGVIMREGYNIRGLNTAATLWCSAAVGTLAGSGFILQAAIGTAAIISTNLWLREIGRRIDSAPMDQSTEVETRYQLRLVCSEKDEVRLRTLLLHGVTKVGIGLTSLSSTDVPNENGRMVIEAEMHFTGRNDPALEGLVATLSLEPGVSAISWKLVG